MKPSHPAAPVTTVDGNGYYQSFVLQEGDQQAAYLLSFPLTSVPPEVVRRCGAPSPLGLPLRMPAHARRPPCRLRVTVQQGAATVGADVTLFARRARAHGTRAPSARPAALPRTLPPAPHSHAVVSPSRGRSAAGQPDLAAPPHVWRLFGRCELPADADTSAARVFCRQRRRGLTRGGPAPTAPQPEPQSRGGLDGPRGARRGRTGRPCLAREGGRVGGRAG